MDAFLNSLGCSEDESESDTEAEGGERSKSRTSLVSADAASVDQKVTTMIPLPKDFDPVAKLNEVESTNAFLAKSGCSAFQRSHRASSCETGGGASTLLASRRAVRDMQVLGCLILELFLPKKFLALGGKADLKARYDAAAAVLRNEPHLVPMCVRQAVRTLLLPDFKIDPSDKYPAVSDAGLPPPTAQLLLNPALTSIHFPLHFSALAKILRGIDTGQTVAFGGKLTADNLREVAEFRVKLAAAELQPIYESLRPDDMQLLLPMVKALFEASATAVVAAWYLLEPVGRLLGPSATLTHLLHPILAIYDGSVQTSKHLKLYHRSFLQFLIVRFGTGAFLDYFSTYLIEAVGGYKDYEDDQSKVGGREGLERLWHSKDHLVTSSREVSPDPDDSQGCDVDDEEATPRDESLAEGEVFAFDNVSMNEAESADNNANESSSVAKDLASKGQIYIPAYTIPNSGSNGEVGDDHDDPDDEERLRRNRSSLCTGGGNIAQVAAESVLWLAHRIGPVLTAKFLSRNLLRMLNLCYASGGFALDCSRHPDHKIRICVRRLHGDDLAQNVLDCLSEIACLYGDQIILLQYLPYAWDLVALCKRRMTPNLEGGLLGCIALLHHIIPYLSDSVLMNELPDNILANVLFPALQIATSRTAAFSGGGRARKSLVYKFLDVVYMIGLRIGEEMARSHLTPLCSAFFASFDKVSRVARWSNYASNFFLNFLCLAIFGCSIGESQDSNQ
jgi:WD repeat-containing protein 81